MSLPKLNPDIDFDKLEKATDKLHDNMSVDEVSTVCGDICRALGKKPLFESFEEFDAFMNDPNAVLKF